jgi:hypothetical protein
MNQKCIANCNFIILNRLIDLINKVTNWLHSILCDDNPYRTQYFDSRFYYKYLAVLEVNGYLKEVKKISSYVKARYFSPGEIFRSKERNSELTTVSISLYIYPISWIITTIPHIDNFDLSVLGLECLLRFQKKTFSGFFSRATTEAIPLYSKGRGAGDYSLLYRLTGQRNILISLPRLSITSRTPNCQIIHDSINQRINILKINHLMERLIYPSKNTNRLCQVII